MTPQCLSPVYRFVREERKVVVATAIATETERIELESAPGGFVVVRRMTWGEKMYRTEMAGKLKIHGKAKKGGDDTFGEIDMMNAKVQMWEFANLIIDHNLERQDSADSPPRPLNFKNPDDVNRLA